MREDDPWMVAMMNGDFQAAWRVSDRVLADRQTRRVDCSHWPRHQQFIWSGERFDDKRVLVRCYHGLGDTIQFARLLEPLRQRAREVIVWAQPALLRLLEGVRGVDHLMPLHDGVPDVAYDIDMELMELAHALRIDASQLPGRVPYIYVSPLPYRAVDAASMNVGIAWRSGDWNPRRSLPIDAIAKFGNLQRVRIHSLQYPPQPLPFDAIQLGCEDIYVMAQRMLQLDAIVSVDTMVAHLAGALGLRTYLLLDRDADWRWQRTRGDSPWYPSMQLVRQRTSDWNESIEHVCAALTAQHEHITAARDTRSVGCTTS